MLGRPNRHPYGKRIRMRLSFSALLLLLLPAVARAVTPAPPPPTGPTGVLAVDFALPPLPTDAPSDRAPFADDSIGIQVIPRKSVWLAGGLSAILPGAGQIYAEAPWWRTALYAVVEAAGWTGYLIYDAKGAEATTAFEHYADDHWDVTRYIDWIAATYRSWPDSSVDKAGIERALLSVYRSDIPTENPWDRVDFDTLRVLERGVNEGFSHTLPNHGEQQYYEQVGKYVQYRAGWDDHNLNGDSAIYDPSRVSGRNKTYTGMRADANSFYSTSETLLTVVILNHIVSMLDAAFTAGRYNARITMESHGALFPDGRIRPVGSLTLRVGF